MKRDNKARYLYLLNQAQECAKKKHFKMALQRLEDAEKVAPTEEQRFQIFVPKVNVFQAMDQKKEALALSIKGVEIGEKTVLTKPSTSMWEPVLRPMITLLKTAAFLSAELDQPIEAFEFADKSKAINLRMISGRAGAKVSDNGAQVAAISFGEAKFLLSSCNAGMVEFCVKGDKAMAVVLDPGAEEPECTPIPLNEGDLNKVITLASASGDWTEKLFASLPKLSKILLPPLDEISTNYKTLFIVPDSLLSFIPFGALTFDRSTMLIDRCALSYVPSASLLKWFRSRKKSTEKQSCFVIGVGSEPDGAPKYFFDQQAENIAKQMPCNPGTLLGDEATPERVLANIKCHDIIHISCHGGLENSCMGALSASRLILAKGLEKDYVTAKEIFDLNGQLHADLVFLNACSSGAFQRSLGSEMGGFLEAFLRAGARSIIATLYHVDPPEAENITINFYNKWLNKRVPKAEALRLAQLEVRNRRKNDIRYWASHVLVGDIL